jgi:hypothetical protein
MGSAKAVTTAAFDTTHALNLAYRSLETNPNSAIALTVAGRTVRHYAKGTELLSRAQRLSPRDPRAWYRAGPDDLEISHATNVHARGHLGEISHGLKPAGMPE